MTGLAGQAAGQASVRGRLAPGESPALKTGEEKLIRLEGDTETTGVIKDERLKDVDFEAVGEFLNADRFRIGPIHEKSMWVWKDGHKHSISYWCEVCAIRTYTPGICMCCQEETAVDLRTGDGPGQ
jgi:hypothetical protein